MPVGGGFAVSESQKKRNKIFWLMVIELIPFCGNIIKMENFPKRVNSMHVFYIE